jgi:hypothetical protein
VVARLPRVVRQVRFTSEQWAQIQKRAREEGIPDARFMRLAVLQAANIDLLVGTPLPAEAKARGRVGP